MLPKLQRRSLVGFDNGSKSVMYYNPKTRKVLTLHNFCFLNPTRTQAPLEKIGLKPDTLHEGELGTGMQNATTQGMEGSMQENAAKHVPNKEPPGS